MGAALVKKTVRAAKRSDVARVVIGGGVAANSALRVTLKTGCDESGLNLILTPMELCTDNAAMIAALRYHQFKAARTAEIGLEPRSGLVRTKKIKRRK